jgi:hypothetical protein
MNFIYRLHPRLARNRRDPMRSPHLDRLLALLDTDDRPTNLIVNTPEQSLSLYELAMIAHAGLNWSSSAGLEFLALGIPVIGMKDSQVQAYPVELNFELASEEPSSLASALRRAIESGWSEDLMRAALRYIAAITHRAVIPIVLPESTSVRSRLDPLRALAARLPAPARSAITALASSVRRASRAASPIARPTQRNEVPAPLTAAAEHSQWLALLEEWTTWGTAPADSSDVTENMVIRQFAAHVASRLAPWDGSEGAVAGLRNRNV